MNKNNKINIYDFYKPFRNKICNIDLKALLELIHRVQRGHENSVEIKFYDYAGNVVPEIYRWELHLLAREALLNTSMASGKRIPSIRDLLNLVSQIRVISNEISRKTIHSGTDAIRSTHTLLYQQVRWQHTRDWDRFYRTYRVYNDSKVNALLYSTLGVRLSTIFSLTFAIAGSAKQSAWTSSKIDYSFMDISNQERDAYFAMVGSSHKNLLKEIQKFSHYDESWAYTWNPLENFPLIQLRADRPHEYLCPLPELLLRRATDSLFFDIAKSKEDFGNPYGMAFQRYVGDVLRAQFKEPKYCILEEKEYRLNKSTKKHGVDWTVSDTTGHIMFECKTRRIKVDARAIVEGTPLTDEITELAKLVVQHYKNIKDALNGYTHWKPDSKPVYPIIVTFDEWYIFAPHVIDLLTSQVHEQLSNINLAELLKSHPFTVTSIAQLEQAGQAIAQIGIERFCSTVIRKDNRHFDLRQHASEEFPDFKVEYRKLFPNSAREMLGHLEHLMPLPGS